MYVAITLASEYGQPFLVGPSLAEPDPYAWGEG